MLQTETTNLLTIPFTLERLQATIQNRTLAENLIGHRFSPEWPNPDIGEILPFIIKMMEEGKWQIGWNAFIIHKADDLIIGDIGLKGGPDAKGVADIGYGIVPSYRGHGYATEAVQGVMDWAFSEKQLTKLTADCLQTNLPSVRVLEKAGFQRLHQESEILYWQLEKV